MDSQDYPIQHFERMALLTSSLRSLPAELLHHQYSYETFGSWAIVLRIQGLRLRLSFDGRDSAYSIERSQSRNLPDLWGEARWLDLSRGDPFPISEMVAALIEAAA